MIHSNNGDSWKPRKVEILFGTYNHDIVIGEAAGLANHAFVQSVDVVVSFEVKAQSQPEVSRVGFRLSPKF